LSISEQTLESTRYISQDNNFFKYTEKYNNMAGDFFNQVLERRLAGLCLWENFNDKNKRRIYELTGRLIRVKELEKDKFEIWYLDRLERGYKTLEEMNQDCVATPSDLINFGKASSLPRVVSKP
jgi:hypothetical protein